ncbi:MAG: hypothetical protein GXO76_07910 [Calditrichaeota bacterium]|nr:hypothetical protein [Calditrichota bacterium]
MSDKEVIKFKYIFSEDYNPIYINGAFGGINPRGELVINFYFERHGLPISQSYEITKEGMLGDEIDNEPSDLKSSMVRIVKNGIILNLQSAQEIHKWLGDYIKKLQELTDINKTK